MLRDLSDMLFARIVANARFSGGKQPEASRNRGEL